MRIKKLMFLMFAGLLAGVALANDTDPDGNDEIIGLTPLMMK